MDEIEKACIKWEEIHYDKAKFRKWLLRKKWKNLNRNSSKGIFKFVYSKDGIVVKFDNYADGTSHTLSEYLSWVHSSKSRRKAMCPPIKYFKGLLFQPLLSVSNVRMENVPIYVHRLARKHKFSHYWNYGKLNGRIKFYDTDSLYYVMTDKEERK